MPPANPPPPFSTLATSSGVRPRSFQLLMTAAARRAGQRFSSMPAAVSNCFSNRTWSSELRMVKLDFRPTASAWMRRMRAPTEWNVPIHRLSTGRFRTASTRAFISRAALLVKVTAKTSWGLALPLNNRCARRVVSTRVLPVPAPANTNTGPSIASTAWRWASFRDDR